MDHVELDRGRVRHTAAVARVANMPAGRFLRNHYRANEPVVLTGFLESWPAFGKWNPEFFAEFFGDAQIEVMSGLVEAPHYQRHPRRSRHALLEPLPQVTRSPGRTRRVKRREALATA